MHFNLNENISNFLKIIINCAKKQNVNVYFVGGIVRDNVLNIPIRDIDIIINSDAIKFSQTLPDNIVVKSIHKDFYTVKVQYKNLSIDIASTRVESYPYSGCLPVVNEVGVDIFRDSKRRDFTVNSIYCKLNTDNDNNLVFEFLDPCNGLEDINEKTLRVLHDNSYIDDPTRVIRGVDFKNRFGFDFSYHDKNLITEFFNNFNIENASYDRILSVFKQALYSDANFKDIVLKQYYKLINNSILSVNFELIDKILQMFKFEKSEFYTLVLLNKPIAKINVNTILDARLKLAKLKDYELAYYYYKTLDNCVLKYLETKDMKLLISGFDLISIGYNEGLLIGNILNKLLEQKICFPNMFKTKEDELNWVKNNF